MHDKGENKCVTTWNFFYYYEGDKSPFATLFLQETRAIQRGTLQQRVIFILRNAFT